MLKLTNKGLVLYISGVISHETIEHLLLQRKKEKTYGKIQLPRYSENNIESDHTSALMDLINPRNLYLKSK